LRKYVFLCTVCGGLASLLGGLFLAVYLILRSYTSSLDYFETIPTYIPASMLLVTGLGIMCLARRRNRYAFLIKLCGVCCLLCAAICVLVTVTTTVIHMSRLQSLRECVYTLRTHTCTCYSMLLDSASDRTDEGAHYVFNSTPDCEVIHGALYSCLRAMFGLSVIGILVCIFCCMLVYQLLSHERKKMYWEQLELRCRYLYGQPRNQPQVINPPQRCSHCACSQQFRYQAEGTFDSRLWASGRIGNLYSPNPVAPSSGWGGWRLPWSRNSETSHRQNHPLDGRDSGSYHRPLACSSPESQYGFSPQGVATVSSATSASYTMIDAGPVVPESCSSSAKSSDNQAKQQVEEEIVSPRIKYLRQSVNNKRNEPTESEVYFADVSSCCNGSVRNDSLLYDEPGLRSQIQEKEFQKIPEERASPEAYSEMALDGSEDEDEEEDPELVSFSQRQPSRNRNSAEQASSRRNTPNSENSGSANSVWSGYSQDFLAPDAQYETIPEHRMMQENSPNNGKPTAVPSPSKHQDWMDHPSPSKHRRMFEQEWQPSSPAKHQRTFSGQEWQDRPPHAKQRSFDSQEWQPTSSPAKPQRNFEHQEWQDSPNHQKNFENQDRQGPPSFKHQRKLEGQEWQSMSPSKQQRPYEGQDWQEQPSSNPRTFEDQDWHPISPSKPQRVFDSQEWQERSAKQQRPQFETQDWSKNQRPHQEWQHHEDPPTPMRFIQNVNPERKTSLQHQHSDKPRNEINSPKMRQHFDQSQEEHPSSLTNYDAEHYDELEPYNEPQETKFISNNFRNDPNDNSTSSPSLRFDRCGNFPNNRYPFDQRQNVFEVSNHPPSYNFEVQSDPNLSPSKHHYEQIVEDNGRHHHIHHNHHYHHHHQRHPHHIDQQEQKEPSEPRLSKDVDDNRQNSPKVFEKFQHPSSLRAGGGTSSTDCINLVVDESQCCHNDPSCRCYVDVDNSVHQEPIKSVDI
ncbi:hypothetical protein AAG570_010324, partial [Ranatra chinensis]